MKRTIRWAACLVMIISLTSCTSLMKNNKLWVDAVNFIEDNFVKNFDMGFYVDTGGFFERPDAYSLDDICIIIHGWARSADYIKDLDEPGSLYFMAMEHYDGRVWVVNYASSASAEVICQMVRNEITRELFKISSTREDGKLPEIHVVAHSFGSIITRYLVRNNHNGFKFEKVALITPPNRGLGISIAAGMFDKHYSQEMERVLSEHGMPNDPEYYQSAGDMIIGSEFMGRLNKPSERIDVIYNMYAIIDTSESNLLKGTDHVVSLKSAYPYRKLLRKGEFEDVLFGSIVFFYGEELTHFSCLSNETVMGKVFDDLENHTDTTREPPRKVRVDRVRL